MTVYKIVVVWYTCRYVSRCLVSDIASKGGLTFQEYVLAIAVFCRRATFIDLETFAFEVFDLRGDQILSLDELLVCANSVDMELARQIAAAETLGTSGSAASRTAATPSGVDIVSTPTSALINTTASFSSTFAAGILSVPRLIKSMPFLQRAVVGSRSPSVSSTRKRSPSSTHRGGEGSIVNSQKRLYKVHNSMQRDNSLKSLLIEFPPTFIQICFPECH